MQCELCKKTIRVNYGSAEHVFCRECAAGEKARQIMKNDAARAGEITRKNDMDIPLKTSAGAVLVIAAAVGLTALLYYKLAAHFDRYVVLAAAAAVIGVFIGIRMVKYICCRKVIKDKIIAQSVKNKLNYEFVFNVITAVLSAAAFLVTAERLKEAYDFLWQQNYMHSVLQMFNAKLLNDIESYAYANNKIVLYSTVLTIQHRLAGLLIFLVCFAAGVLNLISARHSDAVTQIGIFTKGGILKWQQFTAYTWAGCSEEKAADNSAEYCRLELIQRNGKLLTYILKEKESRITLKIRSEDKEKVDNFLCSAAVSLCRR